MENSSAEQYLEFSAFKLNWCFTQPENSVPPEDIKKIKPLSEKFSSALWEKQISSRHRHLMLSPKNELPFVFEKDSYNWFDDWGKHRGKEFSNYLQEKFPLPQDQIIHFFWMKELAVETTWEMFLKHWRCFLYEDEAPILLSSSHVFTFGPNGDFFFATK